MKATTTIDSCRHILELSDDEAFKLAGILYEAERGLSDDKHAAAKRALRALQGFICPPMRRDTLDLDAVQAEESGEVPDG